jgi:hypothetical protein
MGKYTDTTTTSFPKMGDEGIPHSIVNVSAANRGPYTQGKKTMGRGKSPTGTKANRGGTLKGESAAPTFRPVTTIAYPNAPEAQATQSRTYLVPSAGGFKSGRGD